MTLLDYFLALSALLGILVFLGALFYAMLQLKRRRPAPTPQHQEP